MNFPFLACSLNFWAFQNPFVPLLSFEHMWTQMTTPLAKSFLLSVRLVFRSIYHPPMNNPGRDAR